MRGFAIPIALVVLTITALAQGNTGSISGTIKDPDGNFVFGALVQARHIPTGKVFKMETLRNGTYTLSRLPAGAYDLWLTDVGFLLMGYKKSLDVGGGDTIRHDIVLKWGNTGALGDDLYLEVHNRNARRKLTGRTPRMANGKPDLSGVWLGVLDTDPETADALPWAEEAFKARLANDFRDLPSADCLPGEVVPVSPLIYKIVQTPSLIVQLMEGDPHFRQIYLDGRAHPKDLDPTWMGHSIGKWEGDTLVIDTVGFNDKSWLPNMMPHTDKLHIVERYSRPDLAHLNIHIRIEDPGTLKKPWNVRMVWELTPDEEVPEFVCNENNKFRELAGDK